jgi:type II secretory pathway component GspD/PulD (secretin)
MKTTLATLLVIGIQSWSSNLALLAAEGNEDDSGQIPPAAAASIPANHGGDEATGELVIAGDTLPKVVQSLATMANMNVLPIDRLFEGVSPEGKPLAAPLVPDMRFQRITPEQALRAVLYDHGLELYNLPDAEGVWTVRKRSTVEPRITEVVPIRYGAQYSTNAFAITNLSSMLVQSFPNSRVIADARTSQLLINATKSDWLEISNLLVKLDVPVKQILIEARFVQTSQRPESVKGIDWSPTLEGQTVTFGNGLTQFRSTTVSPGSSAGGTSPSGRPLSGSGGSSSTTEVRDSVLAPTTALPGLSLNTATGFTPATAFLSAEGVKVVLSFLNKDADSEFIANPRAVALEGQPTELSDVVNIPVFEEQQGQITGNSTQPNTVKPNYELRVGDYVLNEVGVKLIVTPRITGDTNVFMDLKPEISSKGPDEVKVLGGRRNESPTFLRRKVTTQAVVPSGHTLVLGGLLSDEKNRGYIKVPILGDLPIIGLAFRKDTKMRNKKNLIIFVTPTIIEHGDFQPSDRGREFLKNRLVEPKEEEPSAWDSGKPHDWTKPVE